MKTELIKALNDAITSIPMKSAALSFSVGDSNSDNVINLRVIQNAEDDEIPVITTFIKTMNDFYLMNGLNQDGEIFEYSIVCTSEDECLIILFNICDTENFS